MERPYFPSSNHQQLDESSLQTVNDATPKVPTRWSQRTVFLPIFLLDLFAGGDFLSKQKSTNGAAFQRARSIEAKEMKLFASTDRADVIGKTIQSIHNTSMT
jgi:hypothetical protein